MTITWYGRWLFKIESAGGPTALTPRIATAKVTDKDGPIQAGDLLVTSSTPGHAPH